MSYVITKCKCYEQYFGESLFDDFFDDFARPMRTASRYNTSTGIMRTDVKESDTGYELDT